MTLKPITVTDFLQKLQADASTYETRAAVEQLIGEYLDTAKQLQDAGMFSDGYHTFEELYAHRVRLFTCLMHAHRNRAWWSTHHADGSGVSDGKFIIAGINTPVGQATYHIPKTETDHLPQGTFRFHAPEFDGHTSAHVLLRLLSLNHGNTEGTAIEPISPEGDEIVVYQYAASANTARGSVHWDGVVTAKLITGIEAYLAARAEIARDGNISNPELVQVHNLAMVGFQPAKAGE